MNNAPGQRAGSSLRVCLSMCQRTHAQVRLRIVELQNRRKRPLKVLSRLFSVMAD